MRSLTVPGMACCILGRLKLAAFCLPPGIVDTNVLFDVLVDVLEDDPERAEWSIGQLRLTVAAVPRPALFLAGQAFLRYRRSGAGKSNVLSDFVIGAHAAVERCPLLTRDAQRYRSCFPTVELIAP